MHDLRHDENVQRIISERHGLAYGLLRTWLVQMTRIKHLYLSAENDDKEQVRQAINLIESTTCVEFQEIEFDSDFDGPHIEFATSQA